MKQLWTSMALAGLLGVVALAQDAPKKITRAAALGSVATKIQPDYPPMARQLKIQGSVEIDVAFRGSQVGVFFGLAEQLVLEA